MIHILGTILLIAAASSIGVLETMELRRKPRELRALIQSLSILKHDLVARTLPLPDAIAHVAGQCASSCRPFYLEISDRLENTSLSFFGLWSEETQMFAKLGREARDAFEELGAHLGKYDVHSQAEAIESCAAVLRGCAERADARFRQYGKLYTGLGLTLGAMLAVALY